MLLDGIHRTLLVRKLEIDLAGILITGNLADELTESDTLLLH